jgi:probable F420-dependent oxidoreductase
VTTRAFRFGATMQPLTDRRSWEAQAREIQQLGFSVLTVQDHFGASGGIWGSLVAAHQAAPRLRLGTLVLNSDMVGPVVAAREAITTDIVTDGRFEFGVGAGWLEADYEATGTSRLSASTRVAKLEEWVQVATQALDAKAVQFTGKHFEVHAPRPLLRPVQPKIPLVIGGGSQRVLQIAGRYADTVSIHRNLERGTAASWAHEIGDHGRFPDAVSERINWVRSTSKERFAEIELHALILKVIVTNDRAGAAQQWADAQNLPVGYVRASPHFLFGTTQQIADDLRARRDHWGISYWTVAPGNDLSKFGPVVSTLTGN